MNARNSTRMGWLTGAVLATLGTIQTPLAAADITIEERISTDGFGPMKIGAMDGTTSTAITADKARIDSQIQFKSRLLRAFGGDGATAQIIRLDQGKMYDLDIGRKRYTETSFDALRANMTAAMGRMEGQEAQPATAPSGAPVNEAQCDWSPARTEVKRSGARSQIAGFDTEQATIVVTQTCTDRETKAVCDFTYSMDQWLSQAMPGGEQARSFWQAYARQLGSEEMLSGLQMRSQQVLARYKDGWGEALKSASELQGYPLRTTLTMQVGGPSCAQGSTQTADGSVVADAGEAGVNAGASTAASAATSAAAQKAAEEAGGGVAGGIAGSAAGAFGGTLAGGLLNRMRRRPAEPAAAAPAEPPPAPGTLQLFRMTSETVAVRETAVATERFEIPSGFTLTRE